MTTLVYITVFFATATIADWLAILWHDAREKLDLRRVISLGVALELINWAPIVAALEEAVSIYLVVLAHIAGAVAGSALGVFRLRQQRTQTDAE